MICLCACQCMNTDINDTGSEWIILSNNRKYDALIALSLKLNRDSNAPEIQQHWLQNVRAHIKFQNEYVQFPG